MTITDPTRTLITSSLLDEMVTNMKSELNTFKNTKDEATGQITEDLNRCEPFTVSLGDKFKTTQTGSERFIFMLDETLGIEKGKEGMQAVKVSDKEETVQKIKTLSMADLLKIGAAELRLKIFRAISSKHDHYKRINDEFREQKQNDLDIATKAAEALAEKQKAETHAQIAEHTQPAAKSA